MFIRGAKLFELSNHLGNVLVTVTDRRQQSSASGVNVDYYQADVVGANDYYPFGMQMPGRKYSVSSAYRYGFNGKENDNDVKGEGNQQDYGMRIYDPRLGRFLSVDPLTKSYPYYTPYQFSSNTPISSIDIDGLESDKNYNLNEELKNGLGWLIKTRASEAGILFKVIVNLNPYTSLAIKATRGLQNS